MQYGTSARSPILVPRRVGPSDPTLQILEMSDLCSLSDATIDEAMTRTSPGNYALGYMDSGRFQVFYVGRSDSDLREHLHRWVGKPSLGAKGYATGRGVWETHLNRQHPFDKATLPRVANANSSYTHFAYCWAPSSEAAYAKQWRNFDAFGGERALDNSTQPLSPAFNKG